MTKSLDERLVAASKIVDDCKDLLSRCGKDIPDDAFDHFAKMIEAASAFSYCRELIVARRVARQFLDGLEVSAREDLVEFGADRVKFEHIRLIGVEAYLSLSWSLADHISAMAGRVLCTVSGGAVGEIPAKLVSHFVEEGKMKGTTASVVFDSVRHTFGWPIGILYALRNHFIHDGAFKKDLEFFAGKTSAEGFKVSEKSWKQIERKALTYGLQSDYTRAGAAWPVTPCDDLRVVLTVCEREMDDAMGVLLGSACSTLAVHLAFILGND